MAIISEPIALDDVALKASVSTSTRHPILGFIVRRVSTGVLTLWIVSILIFAATNILPGNVAEVVLGRNATPGRVRALDIRLGLNHPMVQRYAEWLFGVLHANFGQSAVSVALNQANTSVSSTLVSPLLNSLILAGITALLLVPLTLLLGALAGVYARRSLDHAISIPALVLGGLPEFVTGTLFIYIFFVVFHILPQLRTLLRGNLPSQIPRG